MIPQILSTASAYLSPGMKSLLFDATVKLLVYLFKIKEGQLDSKHVLEDGNKSNLQMLIASTKSLVNPKKQTSPQSQDEVKLMHSKEPTSILSPESAFVTASTGSDTPTNTCFSSRKENGVTQSLIEEESKQKDSSTPSSTNITDKTQQLCPEEVQSTGSSRPLSYIVDNDVFDACESQALPEVPIVAPSRIPPQAEACCKTKLEVLELKHTFTEVTISDAKPLSQPPQKEIQGESIACKHKHPLALSVAEEVSLVPPSNKSNPELETEHLAPRSGKKEDDLKQEELVCVTNDLQENSQLLGNASEAPNGEETGPQLLQQVGNSTVDETSNTDSMPIELIMEDIVNETDEDEAMHSDSGNGRGQRLRKLVIVASLSLFGVGMKAMVNMRAAHSA